MRTSSQTNSFAKGVLDPNLSERTDLAHYYQSLADAMNAVATPQGGVADRGGTMLVSDADIIASGIKRRLRYRLEPIHLTSGMVTAANGGTAANAVDQSPATVFTTSAVAATPFVVLEIDLGTARRVDAVDVAGFKAATLGINECLVVEWYDIGSSSWKTFGGAADNAARKHIRTIERTRRFSGWPGEFVTARQFRIVLHGAAGAGAITLGNVRLWTETQIVSPARLFTMARSQSEVYQLVLTDRNIDVFRAMRWQASIPVDIAGEQIDLVKAESSLDTLLLFHNHVETIEIVRQGSDGEWNATPPAWTNVPKLKTTTAFSGSQDEIQEIGLAGIAAGRVVHLLMGTLVTAPITYTNDATFATDAATALGGLPGIAVGDVAVTVAAAKVFRVHFQDDNGSRCWPLVVPVAIGSDAALPPTTVVQRGLEVSDTALLWSAKTGWPRCGAFVQSRLMLGGCRAAPTSYAVSVVALYFDFQLVADPATADRGFVKALDVDEIEEILDVFVGPHIQIFTTSGEWFLETRTIDATKVENAVLTGRNGIKPEVAPVFSDGFTIFVQSGGMTLQKMAWDINRDRYGTDPLSVLAPHLLRNVVDCAQRTARSVREGNRILMINADGTAAMLTLLQSQDVVATLPWSTPSGAFRRCAVDINHNLLFIVERDGALYLEQWVADLPLDAATTLSGSGLTAVTDLPFPDGREVWAYADDELVGPLAVSGGAVVVPASSKITVGLAPEWRARLPVPREKPTEAKPWRPPLRIYAVGLSLIDTGDIALSISGKTAIRIPLTRSDGAFVDGGPLQTETGGAPGLPMLQRLYTGEINLDGLTGWSKAPYVELTRTVPAPVHVKAARQEVAHG